MEGREEGKPWKVHPSQFVPSNPPQIIHCAPIESTMTFPVSMIWAFSNQPHIPLLLESLASVLNDYPVLCASLHEDAQGNLSFHLDNSNPVEFSTSSSPLCLSDCLPSPHERYSPSYQQMYDWSNIPTDLTVPVPQGWVGPSIYLKWTKMACGGCFLGLSGFHTVDAQSVSTFVSEWGRRSLAIMAKDTAAMRVLQEPSFDRLFFSDGMEEALESNPLSCCVYVSKEELTGKERPHTKPPKVISRVYHFPRKELVAIRKAATLTPETTTISVYDALYSHMMQVICKASNTVSADPVLVCQTYNGRRMFDQPNFFGSAAFWISHRTTFASILSSLSATALAVHNSHALHSRATLLAFNGYIASFPKYSDIGNAAQVTTYDLHVASWRNSGMYNVDFGTGAPLFAGPAQRSYPRFMIFIDTPKGCDGEGGVDVCLALEEDHWKNMMQQGNLHCYAKNLIKKES